MTLPQQKITIVGAGLIGRAWAVAFARGGCAVTVWDGATKVLESFAAQAGEMAGSLEQARLLEEPVESVMERISTEADLEKALSDCELVQESLPEVLALKREIFARLDALAPPEAVLSSSSSALLPSAISEGLPGRSRCMVCHPLNPPYLIPAIEIVPAPWTSTEALAKAETLMRCIGQSPIVMGREIDAFVINRLQGALLKEAFDLVGGGYATPEEIDISIRDGLAMRWAVVGPFETIDLNAPGGVRDYVERYAGIYEALEESAPPSVSWRGQVLDKVEAARRAALPLEDIPTRQHWRDLGLMKLAAIRKAQTRESKP